MQAQMQQIYFNEQLSQQANQKKNIFSNNSSINLEQNKNKIKEGTGVNLKEIQSQIQYVDQQKSNQKKRNRSYFHNFQKHLVITLKNVIKFKQYKTPNKIQLVSLKIWNIFKSVKSNNKNTLHVLFGVANDYKQSQGHLSKPALQKLGFLPIYQEYKLSQIEDAQQNLRKQITSQLKVLSEQLIFQGRKIQKLEEFVKYFKKFIQQIQRGPMRKRLPKFKALEVKMRSQINP